MCAVPATGEPVGLGAVALAVAVAVAVEVGPDTVTVLVGPGTVTVEVGPDISAVTVAVAVAVTVLVAMTTLMGCRKILPGEASLGVSRLPATVMTRVITAATDVNAVNPALAWARLALISPRCLRRRLLNILVFLHAGSESLAVAPDRVSN